MLPYLSITTPETSFEWVVFLAKKYSQMFLEGTGSHYMWLLSEP